MLNYHTGIRFQQGRGFGSIFGSILRSLKPIARMGLNVGKRFLKSDFAKNLGNTALDIGKSAATNIAVDMLEGKKFADSAQEQIDEAKQKIATTLKGSGSRKRKKKTQILDIIPKKQLKYSLLS
jgi:hypothetical protein